MALGLWVEQHGRTITVSEGARIYLLMKDFLDQYLETGFTIFKEGTHTVIRLPKHIKTSSVHLLVVNHLKWCGYDVNPQPVHFSYISFRDFPELTVMHAS
jgi:hypothetical protein